MTLTINPKNSTQISKLLSGFRRMEESMEWNESTLKTEILSLERRSSKEVGPYVKECSINLPKSRLTTEGRHRYY